MKIPNKLPIFLFLILAISIGRAQNNWQWQNPQPQGKALQDGKFLNSSTGFAVGDEGTIIRTMDGGANWSVIFSYAGIKFYCLDFCESNIILAGGSSGSIFKSTDLGVNWSSITVGITNVYDIEFVNENTGYAVGNKILKTTNAGNNWIQQFQFSYRFNAVSFSDANTVLAVGDSMLSGLVYKTTNGGINWKFQSNQIAACDDIICLDANIAYIATYHQIYKTTNGGGNWNVSYYYQHADYLSVYFTGYEAGFAVGNDGLVSRTFDGGKSWYSNRISNVVEDPPFNLFRSVYFTDSLNGFITGDFGLFFQTTNGGSNWFHQKESINHFYDVSFLNESTGYTCGQSGSIMKTTNGGSKWNLLYAGYNGNLNDMYFFNTEVGIAVGDSGAVLKTINGGNNWTRGFTPTSDKLYSVSFINSNLGIAGSSNGRIIRTTNGGLSWNQTYFGLGESFSGVSFTSVDTVYASGRKVLLKSTNGGINWTTIASGVSNTGFYRLQFFNSSTGFVIGWSTYSGNTAYKLMKTTNGGLSFDTISYGFKNVSFSDVNNGLGLYYNSSGIYNKIRRTTNGGLNWTDFNLNGISNNLHSVFALNENTGFIVGDLGAIIKTNNIITTINNNENYLNKSFFLQQNYPNPFNPNTVISYQLAVSSFAKLKVYDILGNEISTLVSEKQNAGSYSVEFDGSNYSSGIYYYKLEAGNFTEVRKMILLK